jgi:hypothetical protein
MSSAVALRDCSGACAPRKPKIYCTGLNDFNVDCPEGWYLALGATSMEEAVANVCTTVPSGCVVDVPSFVRDHLCDTSSQYNNALCDYDGGDCCMESCLAYAGTEDARVKCENTIKDCIDPDYT